MFLHKQMIWFKDLENNKILSLQFYNFIRLRGIGGGMTRQLNMWSTHGPKISTEHTIPEILGGWAVGAGSSWIANALENFSARPRPSLCKIWNASSISSFEHESEKKVPPSPRPWPRFRSRFSDLSFHQQPCLHIVHTFESSLAYVVCFRYKQRIITTLPSQISHKNLHWRSLIESVCLWLTPHH